MAAVRKQTPNLFLQRIWCYDDCTIGRLTDADGLLLSMTLEPCWRKEDSHCATGKTCVCQGTYRLAFGYDKTLKYQCWKLTNHALYRRIRLCFLAKGGSVVAHTQGDILLGYLGPDDDAEQPFDGQLYRPVEAFERLRDYYVSLRANHSDLVLCIDDPSEPVQWLPAVAAPLISTGQNQLADYILQTL